MSRTRTIVLSAACIVAGLAAAFAADDRTFWMRYFGRAPTILKLPGASATASLPPERATIRGASVGAPLGRCDPGDLATALQSAERWLDARNTDAFLVWHAGCLVDERYGQGDAGTLRSVGPMAKTLVALLAGRAIREGYLRSLEEPVSDQITQWKSDGRRDITWRNVLGMHSGLSWYYQTRSPWGDFQRILYSSDYPRYVLRLALVAPPGRDYDYSAWTYDLAGIALSRATRRPYEELASTLLSQPLGLDDERIYVDRPGGTVHANCCLWTTARDWIRVGAMLVAESASPRLLPAGFVEAMRTGRDDKPGYGLGVFLGSPYEARRSVAGTKSGRPTPVVSQIFQSEPFVADDVLIIEGVENTKAWVIPSLRLIIVRIGGKAATWDDAVVPNLIMRGVRRANDESPANVG